MASDNNPGAQLAAAAVSAPANSSPTQQAAQPSAPTPSVGTPATQNDQRCLWEACSERFPGPEALYEHICDRHIGRKSTNNLNLECHWANCKTKTVKRDHITSHVRVHVPHKPHRCPICGKAFKRPQDLKKHHKTHAEDSGPTNAHTHNGQGPNGHPGGQNGYGGMGGQPGAGFYGAAGMQGGVGMNFAYQGQHGGGYYTHPSQGLSNQYGQVYYNVDPANGGPQVSYARRDDDLQALNSLLGSIKSPDFNPSNYPQFSSALSQAHGLILPPPGTAHSMQTIASHIDNYPSHLPQLTNVRNKADLLLLQDRLNKMMQAIDAHDKNVAQGMVTSSASGANFAAAQMNLGHYNTRTMPPGEHTPALSSGSSEYSPGHSPQSDSSPMVSPAPGGIPSYPHLQGSASLAAAQMSSVPALGNQFDHSLPHRHTGSRLQHAQPASAHGEAMEVDSSSSASKSTRSTRGRDLNIDPALAGPTSGSSSSEASEGTATPSQMLAPSEEGMQWLRDARFVEDLLKFVDGMLDNHQYESDGSGEGSSNSNNEGSDEMEDVKRDSLYPELPELPK